MNWALTFLDWLETILDWLEAFLIRLQALQIELETYLFNMRGHYLQQLWLSMLFIVGAFLSSYGLLTVFNRRRNRNRR